VLDRFFSDQPSLKVCGVTTIEDATALVQLGVDALGINFWEPSKRYCSPDDAWNFSQEVKGQILRVGVFVNNARPLAENLVKSDVIDVVQLHGDETVDEVRYFLEKGIPVIRAVSALELPQEKLPQENFAILIDTPAGKDYGGTGKTFDWSLARNFKDAHPDLPVLLAGGLNPENAAEAQKAVMPSALDVASGAESSPGVKDLKKVATMIDAIK